MGEDTEDVAKKAASKAKSRLYKSIKNSLRLAFILSGSILLIGFIASLPTNAIVLGLETAPVWAAISLLFLWNPRLLTKRFSVSTSTVTKYFERLFILCGSIILLFNGISIIGVYLEGVALNQVLLLLGVQAVLYPILVLSVYGAAKHYSVTWPPEGSLIQQIEETIFRK